MNSKAKCITSDDVLNKLRAKEQEKVEEKCKVERERRKEETEGSTVKVMEKFPFRLNGAETERNGKKKV